MTKTCPYCAESIANNAIKCRYCGEWMPEAVEAEHLLVSQCPHCAEVIRPSAHKCKHCHEWLIAHSSDSAADIEPMASLSTIPQQTISANKAASHADLLPPQPAPTAPSVPIMPSAPKTEPAQEPQVQPTEAQTTEAQTTEAQATEAQAVEPQAAEPQTTETQTTETQTTEEPAVAPEPQAQEKSDQPPEVGVDVDMEVAVAQAPETDPSPPSAALPAEQSEDVETTPHKARPKTIPSMAELPKDGFATMSQVFASLDAGEVKPEVGSGAAEPMEAQESSETTPPDVAQDIAETEAEEAQAASVTSADEPGVSAQADVLEESAAAENTPVAESGEEAQVSGEDVNDTMIGDNIAPTVLAQAQADASASGEQPAASNTTPAEGEEDEEVEETLDADLVFEAIMQDMTDDEFKMFEVLSTVRRKFWAPLRSTFQNLETRNLKKTLQSLDLSPIRLSIRDLIQEVGNSLFDTYETHVEDFAKQAGLPEERKVYLMLESKERELLLEELRSPFREYIERLEHLDEVCETLMDQIDDLGASQRARLLSPLLSSSVKRRLDQHAEARGIEASWRTLQSAMNDFASSQAILKKEIGELNHAMEQFLSQLEPTYSAILNRILEVWSDRLVAALQEMVAN